MPRKYDRYGINRQFRRNPSRKRNPFPYRLPFMPDYRINTKDDPDYDVSAATSSRYRTVMAELVSKHGNPYDTPSKKRPLQALGWNSKDSSKRQRLVTWGALAAQAPQNALLIHSLRYVLANPEYVIGAII